MKPTCYVYRDRNGWRYMIVDEHNATAGHGSQQEAWDAWRRGETSPKWKLNLLALPLEDNEDEDTTNGG